MLFSETGNSRTVNPGTSIWTGGGLETVRSGWRVGSIAPALSEQNSYKVFVAAAILVWLPVFLLNMILGELVPKSYASLHPIKVSTFLYNFLHRLLVYFFIFLLR